MLALLDSKGIRISLSAEKEIEKHPSIRDKIIENIASLNKKFVDLNDVLSIVESISEESSQPEKSTKVEIRRTFFKPIASEYSADIKVLRGNDVTNNSRTLGKIDDFIAHFRNRFDRISRILTQKKDPNYIDIPLKDAKKYSGKKCRFICCVLDKRETKKGNLLLDVEDLTGSFKAIISSKDKSLYEKADEILPDDIISIKGKVLDAFIIVEEIDYPDIPFGRQRKYSENDLSVLYISDIHFGSKFFISHQFNALENALKGKSDNSRLIKMMEKVKYIMVAGDIVDGVGIYPNQEKELTILDIYEQYGLFNRFLENLPDYIEVIAIPGNHDAVRRGEPAPAIDKSFINGRSLLLGNPSMVSVEGVKHLLYHGTSMDSIIARISRLSYKKPELVMAELLKRRHLSPVYGTNPIIPEHIDYLVIEDIPDVVHMGHVHKNGYMNYRNTLLINSGTFQDQTEYQLKQGHIPTPGRVPIYNLKSGALSVLDFSR